MAPKPCYTLRPSHSGRERWEPADTMMNADQDLIELGWRPFFSDQVTADERLTCRPARVMSVHRGMVSIRDAGEDRMISTISSLPRGPEDRPTVGDWLLVDREVGSLERILNRENLFKRPAPGDSRRIKLVAANVDTLFIVTSCNQDFNIARLERYLVLAREVGVHPLVVLTKADLADDTDQFLEAARLLEPGLEVEIIDARDPASVGNLTLRCKGAQTVALVGSSGVGKSTLINTMRGSDSIPTGEIRETDGKGRHTTVVREMHRLGTDMEGGWLIDTPGMREFQLSDATAGLAEVFDDIAELVLKCRFTNCAHEAEPGCAIRPAFADGTLERDRYDRWRKLAIEEASNSGNPGGRRPRSKTSKRT